MLYDRDPSRSHCLVILFSSYSPFPPTHRHPPPTTFPVRVDFEWFFGRFRVVFESFSSRFGVVFEPRLENDSKTTRNRPQKDSKSTAWEGGSVVGVDESGGLGCSRKTIWPEEMHLSPPTVLWQLPDCTLVQNSPSFSQSSPSLPQNSVRLSEFSSPKQYSRNSIPLPFPKHPREHSREHSGEHPDF